MTNIIIHGAAGRMGQTILKFVPHFPNLRLVGAVDQINQPSLGKDAGTVTNLPPVGVELSSDLSGIIKNASVIIDFSTPASSILAVDMAAAAGKAMVIGTTGHNAEQKSHIKSASREIPIVFSPNMSVGVNLVWKLIEIASQTLSKDYNVDIVETHHVHKKDAPSGTAKRILEIVTQATGHDINKDVLFYENANPEPMPRKAINVKSIREGEFAGTHVTIFTSPRDRIEINHHAFTRDIFAEGALKAAEWIKSKQHGLYDMQDVLNLK
jgi:4-hydroxy-tetrahydrodipicolinate reductase